MTVTPQRSHSSAAVVCLFVVFASAPCFAADVPESSAIRFVPESETEGAARLEIDVPPVRWESVGDRVRPVIEGFGRFGEIGQPDVPARQERIALPADGKFEIVGLEVDWFEGRVPGTPAAYPALDPASPELAAERRQESTLWPLDPVSVVSTRGGFRGLRFATVKIAPLQIDVARGRYRVARRIVLRIDRGELPMRSLTEPSRRDPMAAAAGEEIAHGAEQVSWSGAAATLAGPRAPTDSTPPSYPAWQFEVDRKGLHRITYAWAEANADAYPGLLDFLVNNDPRQYSLSVQGTEIPILVEGEADGSFDPPAAGRPDGDAILFYGQPVDEDILDPDVWQSGDFTDTNVYRLELISSPLRVEPVDGTPQGVDPVPSSFRTTVRHEPDVRFMGFISADGVDHWYYHPWLNTDSDVSSIDFFIATPGHAGGDSSLRARLHSFDDPELHRSEVYVDDQLVDGCGDGDGGCVDWDGFREFTHGVDQGPVTFNRPLSATTKVTVGLPLGRGVGYDKGMLNWVELEYDRLYAADQSRLLFTADNADQEIHLSGFAEQPEVWDLSRTTTSEAGASVPLPRRIDGVTVSGSEHWFEIDPDGSAEDPRSFAAAEAGGFFVPAGAREDRPPSSVDAALGDSLKSGGLGADWVVIGKRELLFADGATQLGPELQALRDRRAAAGGQNLTTAVIAVQDVYDEFSYGIEEPQGIRDFIAYAVGGGEAPCAPGWDPAPSYVILLGDTVWDHKNNYGYDPPRQKVPTYMFDISANTQFGHYPSDTWFSAVCGDDPVPDATIGRIPAHDYAQAEEVFRKIREYETAADAASVTGKALLVSEYETSSNGPFVNAHDRIYDRWLADGPQQGQKIYEQDDTAAAAEAVNEEIDASVNAGAALVSYAGHGGYKAWGKEFTLFKTEPPDVSDKDDLEDVAQDSPLLFTVHANCITGHFAAGSSPESSNPIWYSFVEDWLTTARKGYVGGFAPSHLTFETELDTILDPVYEEIFGRNKERLVAAIDSRLRRDFHTLNKTVALRSFLLQGDPATQLTIPAPPKPDVTSVEKAGSGELLVSWTAPSDPQIAKFRVYRAQVPGGPYTLAGETADANAREYLDTGLRNCTEYFYYVTSVDADGFESRWSNFNEDCGVNGPDCASGVPENPNPPTAPQLLEVNDTQRGQQLEVKWQKVPDDDVIEYKVLYGTAPGAWDNEKTVDANQSSTVIGGLENGTKYYVVVKSVHCTLESDPSNEMTGIPHLVRGINPPDSIRDLRVYREGADVRLEWSVPTMSVWKTETDVQAIEVHGSDTTPAFQVGEASRLTSLGGNATEWPHAGQGTAATPPWHYLVVAVDADGRASAGGVELPAGIEDLTLRKVSAGTEIELIWTAVKQSMDGDRLSVAGYDLHGRASALPRTEVGPSNLLVSDIPDSGSTVGSVTRSVTVPLPPDAFFTYQVLAKDHHDTKSVW